MKKKKINTANISRHLPIPCGTRMSNDYYSSKVSGKKGRSQRKKELAKIILSEL